MANILTIPESGIFFDGNTAGTGIAPILTGDASGVAIQYDGYAGVEINSSATGVNYLDRFSVEGANGRLFGVTDEVTGTVFSVNDAAGLPIIEVESTADHDKITIGEYGTNALVVSGDKVGIGIDDPSAPLDIESSQNVVAEFRSTDNRGSIVVADDDTSIYLVAEGSKASLGLNSSLHAGNLNITSSGEVGIGTTDPDHQLTVAGTGIFMSPSADANNAIRIGHNSSLGAGGSSQMGLWAIGSGKMWLKGYSDMHFGYNKDVTIKDGGNVGIGTTSPKNKLDIIASSGGFRVSDYGGAYFGNSSDTGHELYLHGRSNGALSIGRVAVANLTGGTGGYAATTYDHIHITSSGEVGIGTTSPASKLQVSTTNAANILTLHRDGSDNGANTTLNRIQFAQDFSSTQENWGRIDLDSNASPYRSDLKFYVKSTSGLEMLGMTVHGTASDGPRVGIGTAIPSRKLHVSGDVEIESKIYGSGTDFTYYQIASGDYNHRFYTRTNAGASLERFTIEGGAVDGKAYFQNTNVGIGTTSPDEKLDVVGTGTQLGSTGYYYNTRIKDSTNSGVLLGGNSTENGVGFIAGINQLAFVTYGSGWGERMRIDSAGNVGIGTTTPGSKLVVAGGTDTSYNDGTLKVVGNIALNSANNLNPGLNRWALRVRAGGTEGSFDIYDARNSLSRLTINSSGEVGIGTTNPAYSLHVETGGNTTVLSRTTSNAASAAFTTWNNNGSSGNNMQLKSYGQGVSGTNFGVNVSKTNMLWSNGDTLMAVGTIGATPLIFGTSNVERLRINSSGEVGIGTDSPSYLLDLESTATGLTHNLKLNKSSTTGDYAEIAFQLWSGAGTGLNTFGGSGTSRPSVVLRAINEDGSQAAGAFAIATFTGGSTNSTLTEKFRVTSAGNVGIGTASPDTILEVSSQLSSAGTIDYPFTISSRDDSNSINQAGGEGVGLRFRIAGNSSSNPADSLVGASIAAVRASASDSNSSTHLALFTSQNDETLDEAVRITSDGNVGIGTTNPTNSSNYHTLDIRGTNGGQIIAGRDNAIDFFMYTDSSAADIGALNDLRFQAGSAGGATPKMIITSSGEVGIGTTSPVYKLEVSGDVEASSLSVSGSLSRVFAPDGATYNGGSSSTGYLIVKLPDIASAGINNMMTGVIRVFDYANNESFDVHFSGYWYGSGFSWTRCGAWIDSEAQTDRNFSVRFGRMTGGSGSADRAYIMIGEPASTWSYCKFSVINFNPGHSGTEAYKWNSGWSMDISATNPGTVIRTVANTQSNNWKRNGQDVYYAGGTGNVGIGTTSPSTKLQLGDGSADDVLRVHYTNSSEYLDVHGYGITFFRGSNYLNPSADNSKVLFIGNTGATWNTLNIYGSTTNLYGDLSVSGDLTVNGTTSTINSTTLQVDDKNIELGTVATPTDTTADGGGITLKGATDKTINWVNSTDAWTFSHKVSTSEITTASGTLTLNPAGTYVYLGSGKRLYGANIGFGYQPNAVSAIKFLLGASIDNPDMRIERSSSNLLIQNEVDDGDIIFKSDDSSGGTMEYFRVDGGIEYNVFSRHARFIDSMKVLLGNSDDLQIYHDGTNSRIANTTGELRLSYSDKVRLWSDSGVTNLIATAGGATELYHNGSKKLETTSWGLSLTGNVTSSGNVYAGGGQGFVFGSSISEGEYIYRSGNDIKVYAGGSDRLTVDGDDGNVGINTTAPTYKLQVNGGILAGGKVTYEKSAGSLDTTGYAVAGLTSNANGSSAGFTFTCFGHSGGYQKIVYSCHNVSFTWNTQKVIDEGTNDFDVVASANGSTITFTFKSRSGTKYYTPRVLVEAIGQSINDTYA